MEASFKLGAKDVKECSDNVNVSLYDLKNEQITKELSNSLQFKNAVKLIEKLSIINEYKLNLFKEFSIYNHKKK